LAIHAEPYLVVARLVVEVDLFRHFAVQFTKKQMGARTAAFTLLK